MRNLTDNNFTKLFHLHSSCSVSKIVTRCYSLKLCEPKLRIDIFKFSLQCRIVKLWNKLPKHVCTAVFSSMCRRTLVDDFCV